ncbi:ComF family protein [Planifilum fimeticola]|uniref:ComF family protein n=1 Tax=Planifilum fimeticola TaxID=201975 RepID=A0A2T0LA23_9BACL|nr:ComF family protein [Planifilum fimeticola]PRX38596.1 ComF family protein [Planifilum fimeticola]
MWEHLFPPPTTCWFCSSPAGGHPWSGVWGRLCAVCRRRLVRISPPLCRRCGKPLAGQGTVLCGDCKGRVGHLDQNRSVVRYNEFAREIVALFKYRGRERLARPLGRMMAESAAGHDPLPDWITFVPLHPSRLKERGFNQAELLARIVSARLNRPLIPLLKRVRPTEPQSLRNRRERLVALRGAFALAEDREVRTKIAGTRVLIVDDVYTTGSTLEECARILKEGEVKRVVSVTFAR